MDTLEEQQKARKKAMRLLEHMDRTERGLREKLLQEVFPRKLRKMPLLM